ncbi:hypothetical protein Ae168Ps1_2421c [Pseudonocardia sp. Ae168_Ps1]|uniref:DUF3017 domain-containing protein n=1 Tax=unclassified Pseudonocardia TaxID=2619320 RepID=UPI0006CB06DE|nr:MULTISPECIES: DUF3017 domain-containing protein [unclassified Pseudonocardia]ALE72260.1 hypothetical protein FRP1_02295 [Pseudonocardia sp. EC080625-04]ALL75544.1 hypothetical protein AD006_09915 [Pseudonocardia sp. EC080610-09]ALL82571.1 hypothetical protein AD017_17745 [Pseudonocardia sp. EC080619-01]OLL74037.1 hypothetical protein Ae150APs1_2415c [Pseudonocardia sp. Ae150A_Ps1]OLL80015.1 hypothetical protein Ae168Ps1_2421c [Pseudonocardia sp. Ae168_Ps1]
MATTRSGFGLRARLRAYWPLLTVLAIALIGLQRVATEHWREGSAALGVAMLVAAVLRVVLPPDRVGLLAVRGRYVDALVYGGFGLAVLALALTITRGSLTVS